MSAAPPEPSGVPSDAVDLAAAADPVAAFVEAHERGRAVALRTSGTSGDARAVVRTTGSWVRSLPHATRLTRLGPGDRVWVPGPRSSTMNLFAAVLARFAGARVVGDAEGASHAHLTPLAVVRALDDGVRLPGHVTVAGDRLAPALAARVRDAGTEVAHYYGAAELSFVAWGTHADDLAPFPEVEVAERDGELWVRSPYVCTGYAGEPGPLRRTPDGFATVGDRGRVVAGRVLVAGRGDAAVSTGGATVLVADVERALRAGAHGEVVVVGTPHPVLGAVVTAVLAEPADHGAARDAARSRLAPEQRPRRWFHLAPLPTTPAGKLDRAAVARAVADGRAAPVTGSGRTAPR